MQFDYNTQRPKLVLKEYGRNVQKLAAYINTIENQEERDRFARILTDLMRQIHPNMRDGQDYSNKLWDDLFILSGFNLDVESPYPLPEKNLLGRKPKRVPYNTHELKYKHYGRNVELIIEKAIKITDPEEKEQAIIYLGKLMKAFYSTWNKENVDDGVIVQHIREMSKARLSISLDKVKSMQLFDGGIKEREKPQLNSNNDKNRNRNKKLMNSGKNSNNNNNRKKRKF